MPEVLLGLDIGTSVTKAAVFDRSGRELLRAARPTAIRRPHKTWSEVDPEELWSGVVSLCREITAAVSDIAAIGISGAMVGAWVVDADGRPLRPGILWDDGRTQPWIEAREAAEPGFMARIFASSGSVMQQGCTLPLVRWLIDHEPKVMARAATVFGSKDFVRLRLTGETATDRTEAAVAPGSARDRGRSQAMLDLFGLGEAARLFPPACDSETIAGHVTDSAARATGLRPGTPVAIGAGDVAASVIGAGGKSAGSVVTILGTTCLNGVLVDEPVFDPPDLGLLFTIPGGLWLRTMVNVAGTTNLDWCLRVLCPDLAAAPDPYAALEALAGEAGIGAGGVVYIPYLSDVGIIAPKVEPKARAGFVGLGSANGRADLVRAVYEGVCFAIRDCYAGDGPPDRAHPPRRRRLAEPVLERDARRCHRRRRSRSRRVPSSARRARRSLPRPRSAGSRPSATRSRRAS